MAQSTLPDTLFRELAQPDNPDWQIAESDILREWSRSGSAAMDLLLKRGNEALEAGDIQAAIGHLTALTDHAPDFAAGWVARARAYTAAGLFGAAASDLAQALELEPRQFQALNLLAALLEEIGRFDSAQNAYRESLKIHPNQQPVIDALARLQQRQDGTDI